eukprot:6025963-Amphidinium_carterae.2
MGLGVCVAYRCGVRKAQAAEISCNQVFRSPQLKHVLPQAHFRASSSCCVYAVHVCRRCGAHQACKRSHTHTHPRVRAQPSMHNRSSTVTETASCSTKSRVVRATAVSTLLYIWS